MHSCLHKDQKFCTDKTTLYLHCAELAPTNNRASIVTELHICVETYYQLKKNIVCPLTKSFNDYSEKYLNWLKSTMNVKNIDTS